MVKGVKRLRAQGFQKGHKHTNRQQKWVDKTSVRESIIRVNQQDHEMISQGTHSGLVHDAQSDTLSLPQNARGQVTDFHALRPEKSKSYFEEYSKRSEDDSQYIIVHRQKIMKSWNKAISGHRDMSPECRGDLEYDEEGTSQWGTVWIQTLKCSKCSFKSSRDKLFDEVDTGKRGRKAADANVRLQLGLATQGVGQTGTRHLLSAMNIKPPARTSMQKMANKINPEIVKANQADMKNIREDLKDKNSKMGRPRNVIDVEADGRYNNSWGSGWGKTPTQPATQCSYLVCENVTEEKKVISVGTWSRLCTCDVKSKYGPHKESCPADMASNSVMGNEKLYLGECIGEINADDISIRYLTMDGDFKTRRLLQTILQPDPTVDVAVLYCLRHLNKLLQKTARNQNFSAKMFPGRLKADRQQSQSLFSYDLEQRVQAEMDTAHKLNYDTNKQINFASYLYDTIEKCYMGDHSLCHKYSLVCTPDHPWQRPMINTSSSLNHIQAFINPTVDDTRKLREVLNIRLSRQAVLSTCKNTTQNKCEATNRGISKSNPKHILHKRNFAGRVHAEVHAVNNGPGASLLQLSEALNVPIPSKSPVVSSLKQVDKERQYQKKREKSLAYKTRRAELKRLHYTSVLQRKAETDTYKKHSDVMESLYGPEETLSQPSQEHSYCKRQLRRRPARPRKE